MPERPARATGRPLAGITVLDLTRMLPGAALVRLLLGLGARVIKVEDPAGGDLLRHMPPLVDGVGAGFAAFFAGAESICLDLRTARDAARLRELLGSADVLVESFRPGTLARWGLDPAALVEANPRLVVCSLPAYSSAGSMAGKVGHDLNFTALSGLLEAIAQDGVPPVQLADVTGGLLACSAILAALFERSRTGRGQHLEQPLMAGPLAFMTWLYADAAAGGQGAPLELLAGQCPAYRVYACAGGDKLALGAIEPKFWQQFTAIAGVPEIAPFGLDSGPAGQRAAGILAERLASRPRSHRLAEAAVADLPVTPVNSLAAALADPAVEPADALAIGPWRAPEAGPPALGQDTARILS